MYYRSPKTTVNGERANIVTNGIRRKKNYYFLIFSVCSFVIFFITPYYLAFTELCLNYI